MKNIIIILLASSLFLFSCEEVIEIEVNEADIQLVIEGDISNENRIHKVKLSQTGSYFDPGDFPKIEGAEVTLTTSAGQSETLNDIGEGVYQIENIVGEIGESYTLSVAYEGETFEAISTLPEAVPLSGLFFRNRPAGPFGEDGSIIEVKFRDPEGIPTYMIFELYVNDTLVEGLFLYDDAQSDGAEFNFPLFPYIAQSGDKVRVRASAMDREVYDYFNTLAEIIGTGFGGGGGSAAPANPESNFSPFALGYFGAFAVSEVEGVVP